MRRRPSGAATLAGRGCGAAAVDASSTSSRSPPAAAAAADDEGSTSPGQTPGSSSSSQAAAVGSCARASAAGSSAGMQLSASDAAAAEGTATVDPVWVAAELQQLREVVKMAQGSNHGVPDLQERLAVLGEVMAEHPFLQEQLAGPWLSLVGEMVQLVGLLGLGRTMAHAAAPAPAPRAAASASSARGAAGSSSSAAPARDGRSSAKLALQRCLGGLQQFWDARLSRERQPSRQQAGQAHSVDDPGSSQLGGFEQPEPAAPQAAHFKGLSTSTAAAWVDLLRVSVSARSRLHPTAFAGDLTR